MDLDKLKGEIAAIEDAVKTELEFSTFEGVENEIQEISECVGKLEKLKRELIAKTVAAKCREPTSDQMPSDAMIQKLAEKIKELRTMKRRLNREIKKREKGKEQNDERIEMDKNYELENGIANEDDRKVETDETNTATTYATEKVKENCE